MNTTAAALLVVAGLSMTAQAAEPATLTLACKGTVTDTSKPNAKPEPLSMGIIVNFTARTILGLAGPGSTELVTITEVNDVSVNFDGSDGGWHLNGSLA